MKKTYLLLIPALFFAGCGVGDQLVLKESERTFEYGETIPADPAVYLEDVDEAILPKIEVRVEPEQATIQEQTVVSLDENGKPMDQLNVGTYDLHLLYGQEEEIVHLIVVDTTAPTWNDFPKTVRLEKGSAKSALNQQFACEDLSGCSIHIKGDYDLSTAGEYTITVVATDAYDNQASAQSTLYVEAPKKASTTQTTPNSTTAQRPSQSSNTQGSASKPSSQSGSNAAKPTQPSTPAAAYNTSYAHQVAELVNAQRAANGLDALAWDDSLANAANTRAQELITSFSHTRPDGSSCFTAIRNPQDYGSIGENIAAGQTTPSAVMNAWMNSSGHRANILSEHYTKIGVSCYVKDGTCYWVQVFGG